MAFWGWLKRLSCKVIIKLFEDWSILSLVLLLLLGFLLLFGLGLGLAWGVGIVLWLFGFGSCGARGLLLDFESGGLLRLFGFLRGRRSWCLFLFFCRSWRFLFFFLLRSGRSWCLFLFFSRSGRFLNRSGWFLNLFFSGRSGRSGSFLLWRCRPVTLTFALHKMFIELNEIDILVNNLIDIIEIRLKYFQNIPIVNFTTSPIFWFRMVYFKHRCDDVELMPTSLKKKRTVIVFILGILISTHLWFHFLIVYYHHWTLWAHWTFNGPGQFWTAYVIEHQFYIGEGEGLGNLLGGGLF